MNDAGARDRLLSERAIARVLQRYAQLADERDWAGVSDVFAAHASADYGDLHLSDRNAIGAMLVRALEHCGPTQHLLGIPVIDVDGDRASSRVAIRAAHRGAGAHHDQIYECLGEYHDRWVLVAEGWRIVHRRMVVTLEYGSRRVLTAGRPK